MLPLRPGLRDVGRPARELLSCLDLSYYCVQFSEKEMPWKLEKLINLQCNSQGAALQGLQMF